MAAIGPKFFREVPPSMRPLFASAIAFHENNKKNTSSQYLTDSPTAKIQNFLNHCSVDVLKKLALDDPSTNDRRRCAWRRLKADAQQVAKARKLAPPNCEDWLVCKFLVSVAYFVRSPLNIDLISSSQARASLECLEKATDTILKELEQNKINLKLFDLLYCSKWNTSKHPLPLTLGAIPLQRLLLAVKSAVAENLKLRVSARPTLRRTAATFRIYEACQETFQFQDDELVGCVADLLVPSQPDKPWRRSQQIRLRR